MQTSPEHGYTATKKGEYVAMSNVAEEGAGKRREEFECEARPFKSGVTPRFQPSRPPSAVQAPTIATVSDKTRCDDDCGAAGLQTEGLSWVSITSCSRSVHPGQTDEASVQLKQEVLPTQLSPPLGRIAVECALLERWELVLSLA